MRLAALAIVLAGCRAATPTPPVAPPVTPPIPVLLTGLRPVAVFYARQQSVAMLCQPESNGVTWDCWAAQYEP